MHVRNTPCTEDRNYGFIRGFRIRDHPLGMPIDETAHYTLLISRAGNVRRGVHLVYLHENRGSWTRSLLIAAIVSSEERITIVLKASIERSRFSHWFFRLDALPVLVISWTCYCSTISLCDVPVCAWVSTGYSTRRRATQSNLVTVEYDTRRGRTRGHRGQLLSLSPECTERSCKRSRVTARRVPGGRGPVIMDIWDADYIQVSLLRVAHRESIEKKTKMASRV